LNETIIYNVNIFCSLIACYLVRLDEQFFSELSKYFFGQRWLSPLLRKIGPYAYALGHVIGQSNSLRMMPFRQDARGHLVTVKCHMTEASLPLLDMTELWHVKDWKAHTSRHRWSLHERASRRSSGQCVSLDGLARWRAMPGGRNAGRSASEPGRWQVLVERWSNCVIGRPSVAVAIPRASGLEQ